jgi:hypothetical protein
METTFAVEARDKLILIGTSNNNPLINKLAVCRAESGVYFSALFMHAARAELKCIHKISSPGFEVARDCYSSCVDLSFHLFPAPSAKQNSKCAG